MPSTTDQNSTKSAILELIMPYNFARNLSLVTLLLTSPLMAAENVIHLACLADVKQVIAPKSEPVEFKESFELTIKIDDKDYYISSSSSKLGVSLYFDTKNKRFSNIQNYSNEGVWAYHFNHNQSSGELYMVSEFSISRYTGAFSKTDRDANGFGYFHSEGQCKKLESKLF